MDTRFPLDTKSKKDDAVQSMMEFGAILREKGLNNKYGMTIRQIPQKNKPHKFWPWGVYVEPLDT